MKRKLCSLLLVCAFGGSAAASPPPKDTAAERFWLVGLRHDWGNTADSYEASGRLEFVQGGLATAALGFEGVGGKLGGTPHLGLGANALLGLVGTGVAARAHVLFAFDKDTAGDADRRLVGRLSIGLRHNWIEAGYAYQLPLGGERESWLAAHSLYLQIASPVVTDW